MKLVRINDLNYDPALFNTWRTDTHIDTMFSTKGGLPKATNWMVTGDPGVGKSTVTLDVLSNCCKNGAKVLFISAEMNQIDLYLYVERYPKFGTLDVLFPQDFGTGCPKEILEDQLMSGWDIVLIDSFVEVQEIIKEECKMSGKASEKWLLDLMYRHNLGNNDTDRFTTFLNIQQMTKGGTFVGSQRLKHMTTGMMEIKFDDDNEDERYVTFSKNRRGNVNKRMYFSLDSVDDVSYDFDRFKKNEELQELKKKEKIKMKESSENFDQLFELNR
jgi:predicted ATP-dependent serine protease